MSIHVEQDGECAVCIQQVTPGLRFVRVSWPCDAAAARALADELAEALRSLDQTNDPPCFCSEGWPLFGAHDDVCEPARAALAKWEASRGE